MTHLFTLDNLRRNIAQIVLFTLALTLSSAVSARAEYQGPVLPPSDAFGGPGPYQVLTETLPSPSWAGHVVTVFRPAGVDGPRPTWFFAHGFAGSNPTYYLELLTHLASHGSVVVFSPYPANLLKVAENYGILYDGFVAAVERYPTVIDTRRVGFAGHSYGGGAVPALALRAIRERSWGSDGLALLLLAPWYAYGVTDADLASFPAHTQALVQVYEDDTVNDHRMAIDLFGHIKLSPSNMDYLMARSDRIDGFNYAANHLVPTGVATPRPEAAFNALDVWGVLRMAQALGASALEHNPVGKAVALGHGSLLQIQMGATAGGHLLRPMMETLAPTPRFPSSRYVQSYDSQLNPRRAIPVPQAATVAHLTSLSARGYVGEATERLSIETTVAGPRPKSLLVRALGPTLATLSTTPALTDPALSISRAGKSDTQIDDWSETPDLTAFQAATSEVGAAPLSDGAKDAAILASFWPGSLAVQVQAKENATPGAALLEVFDADQDGSDQLSRFTARGPVVTGSDSLIAGFATVGGSVRVLIRGIEPVLEPAGAKSDRVNLALYKGSTLVATTLSGINSATESEFAAAAAQVGAPAVPKGQRVSCLLVTLEPGAYTLHLQNKEGQTGAGRIEVYLLFQP